MPWYMCTVNGVGPAVDGVETSAPVIYINLTDSNGSFVNQWFYAAEGGQDLTLEAGVGAISSGKYVSVAAMAPNAGGAPYTGITRIYQTNSAPLKISFLWGVNNLPFANPDVGSPDWGTFKDTFGSGEIWSEVLDPIFGHPVLTLAYFEFYKYFLKGTGAGGLATGFCTAMASRVADDLFNGTTSYGLTLNSDMTTWLTGVHGKLLSGQSLLRFHGQGLEGLARVEESIRAIETAFVKGCNRQSFPLLFVIPSGEIWDTGYFDRLGQSHCVAPIRFEYPIGHPGPQLSPDGSTTVSSLDGVKLYVWDCNHVTDQNCRMELAIQNGALHFQYFPDSTAPEFTSEQGFTLGEWNNGNYLLGEHDLPFSGGLGTFIAEFLLPSLESVLSSALAVVPATQSVAAAADLQVTDAAGNRTGTFGTSIHADIPGSHPCYMIPNMFLLPTGTPLSRSIVGNATGMYDYHSLVSESASFCLQQVPTVAGQIDTLSISADGSQIRFAAGAEKTFNLTIGRLVNAQPRAVSITGLGAAPGADVQLTVAADLSQVRLGNQGVARTVQISGFAMNMTTNTPISNSMAAMQLQTQQDLVVTVADWDTVNLAATTESYAAVQ